MLLQLSLYPECNRHKREYPPTKVLKLFSIEMSTGAFNILSVSIGISLSIKGGGWGKPILTGLSISITFLKSFGLRSFHCVKNQSRFYGNYYSWYLLIERVHSSGKL